MWSSESRAECELRRDALLRWLEAHGQLAAADTVRRDWDDFVTFYDFPAEHWIHLRTSNPIESLFAGVRLRTDVAKRMRRRLYPVRRPSRRASAAAHRASRAADPSSQLDLFGVSYTYHAFVTDRAGAAVALEADHRRHAEVENAIRELKFGVGLNHLPSGRFAANAAWLAFNVMAHNLARWVSQLGLGQRLVTTKTLRRRLFRLAGRITRSARRLSLHLPARWPWQADFSHALARLRAIPRLA